MRPWLSRLKRLSMARPDTQTWSMEPVLQDLQLRLQGDDFAVLMALFRAVDGRDAWSALDQHEWWTTTAPARTAREAVAPLFQDFEEHTDGDSDGEV